MRGDCIQFGEMMFPTLPPPIIASKIPASEDLLFRNGNGDWSYCNNGDIDETGTNGSIVAIAIAAITFLWPGFLYNRIGNRFSAEPVLINARLDPRHDRRTGRHHALSPMTIAFTVSAEITTSDNSPIRA